MIILMKRQKIILIALLFFMVVLLKPIMGIRLLENGLFISPEIPSAFDPKLNFMIQVTGTSSGSGSGSDPVNDPMEKTRLPCGEASTLGFRFKGKEVVDDKMKEGSNSEEFMLNVWAKGGVTASGGSERGNNGIRSEQMLAKSKHSPGVDSPKSTQKSGVAQIQQQQHVTNKRILNSTPSPGAGH